MSRSQQLRLRLQEDSLEFVLVPRQSRIEFFRGSLKSKTQQRTAKRKRTRVLPQKSIQQQPLSQSRIGARQQSQVIQRRSRLLMFVGASLVFVAICLFVSIFFMQTNANVSPDPNGAAYAQASQEGGATDGYEDFVAVDWEYWKAINPDLIAWVNVPGTSINYPILRAPKDDPTFYLHHDIYRNYSVFGVPYLDSSSTSPYPMLNAIIYGHHMDNGTMFSDFARYSDEPYACEHATICLQTPAGKQRLKATFVQIINGDVAEKHTCFPDEDAFHVWYEDERSKACVALDESADPAYTVTFCTCSYHQFSNERTLVVCVPINQE